MRNVVRMKDKGGADYMKKRRGGRSMESYKSSQFHLSYMQYPHCHSSAKCEFVDQAHIQNLNLYNPGCNN